MGKMILNGVPYGVTPKETINMKPYSEITLWENTNGLSVSSPTSISLVDDINNYDALCIIHAASAEATFKSSQIIPVSNIDKTGNTNFGVFDVGANNYYYAVLTYIDDTHITLGSWGSQYPIIYYKIIGIKYGGNLSPIIYSEEEREVGVWIDNKPLYQITYDAGSNIDVNYNSWTNITINELKDSENIVMGYGTNSGGTYTPLQVSWTGSVGSKIIQVQTPRNSNNQGVRYFTIRYTKTTDVAGSGQWASAGVPTVHYDASEQVIGTWFGKPLYQKTIVQNNIDVGYDNVVHSQIAHGVANFKEAHSLTIGCPILGICSGDTLWNANATIIASFRVNSTNIYATGGSNHFGAVSDRYWYFTITYTKTTD